LNRLQNWYEGIRSTLMTGADADPHVQATANPEAYGDSVALDLDAS